MLANISPTPPKTPSAMGFPRKPALEQIMEYLRLRRRSSFCLRNMNLPSRTQKNWMPMEIKSIQRQSFRVSGVISRVKLVTILAGSVTSSTRSVMFFSGNRGIRIIINEVVAILRPLFLFISTP